MRMMRSAVAVTGALLVTLAISSATDPTLAAGSASGAVPTGVRAELRSDLASYLATYGATEHISGVSLAVTFPDQRPGIDMAVGHTRVGGGPALSPHALWQIGSNTKAFTSVLVLQLEAEHELSLEDTLGKWLPQYPAWSGVTIKQLLSMTSGIPNYTDSPEFWHDLAAAPNHEFSASQLVSYAVALPPTHGYSYSNTNYILAQMVVEGAADRSYAGQLRRRILSPLGLQHTFYSATHYGPAVAASLPAGYWFVLPVLQMTAQLGKDQSHDSVSWAQGAGGMVSSLEDLTNWNRILLSGQELPPVQQHQLTSLISTTTGEPIKTTTLADPAGYGLGVSQVTTEALGTVWYYEGETDGFRVLSIYVPRSGTAIALGVNSASLSDHTSALGTSVFETLQNAGLS